MKWSISDGCDETTAGLPGLMLAMCAAGNARRARTNGLLVNDKDIGGAATVATATRLQFFDQMISRAETVHAGPDDEILDALRQGHSNPLYQFTPL